MAWQYYSVIAAAAEDGSLTLYSRPGETVPWHTETVAGPGTTFSAPKVAWVGNSAVIAATGANNSLMFYWHDIMASWHAETVAGPGTTDLGPSAVGCPGRELVGDCRYRP